MLKTGRLLIVDEDTEVTNFGEHLLRRAIDEHFYDLLVRPRVLSGEALAGHRAEPGYEQNSVPQLATIKEAMRRVGAEQHKNENSDRCQWTRGQVESDSPSPRTSFEDNPWTSACPSSAKVFTKPNDRLAGQARRSGRAASRCWKS